MKKVLCVAAAGFEETELIAPVDVLRRLGVEVVIAALAGEYVTGAHGIVIRSEAAVDGIDINSFDALFYPGGLSDLLKSDKAVEIAKKMFDNGKIVSAICAAPLIFGKAGILKERRFTMYPGFEEFLGGAVPCEKQTETDGNVVTGRGPGAVFDFAAQLAGALGLAEECRELYKAMFVRVQ